MSGGEGPEMSICLGLSRDPELVRITDIMFTSRRACGGRTRGVRQPLFINGGLVLLVIAFDRFWRFFHGLDVVLGEELGDPAQLPRVVTGVDVNALTEAVLAVSELGTPEQNVVCSFGNAMTGTTHLVRGRDWICSMVLESEESMSSKPPKNFSEYRSWQSQKLSGFTERGFRKPNLRLPGEASAIASFPGLKWVRDGRLPSLFPLIIQEIFEGLTVISRGVRDVELNWFR